jgi:hypothetical protein
MYAREITYEKKIHAKFLNIPIECVTHKNNVDNL